MLIAPDRLLPGSVCPAPTRIRKALPRSGSAWEKAITKSDSVGPPAADGPALPSTLLEFASEALVAVDDSQKVLALGGRAKR